MPSANMPHSIITKAIPAVLILLLWVLALPVWGVDHPADTLGGDNPADTRVVNEHDGTRRGDDPVNTRGWQLRTSAGSAGDVPFWLHSNRYGQIDRYHTTSTLNLFDSWRHTFDSGLTLSLGADLLLRHADVPDLWLQEGYIQLSYGHFLLRAGRKREQFGLLHPGLTSGTMDHSENIRPMPKIVFATDGFQPIPGTSGVFFYDASLAHGWMDDEPYRYVDGVMLHQKHLYLRMFREDAPVVPRAGIKHFAQWGGYSPIYGQSPENLRSWVDVVFALSSDSKELFEGGELSNVFQNHVGTYDFALMVNTKPYRMGISRQFYLEDTPNARFAAYWDGLWGAYIERRPVRQTRWRSPVTDGRQTRWVDGHPPQWPDNNPPLLAAINYEHLNTLDQLTRDPRRGKERYANYYNHWNFLGGWTYEGRVIGNPLYYGTHDFYGVINNKLIAHHVGMMGWVGPAAWRGFVTYSRNYGAQRTYRLSDGERFDQFVDRSDQWSFLLEMHAGFPQIAAWISNGFRGGYGGNSGNGGNGTWYDPFSITASLAYDRGSVYPDNLGVMIGLRWESAR